MNKLWILGTVLSIGLTSCTDNSADEAVAVSIIGGKAHVADPNRVPLDTSASILAGALTQGLVSFDATGQIEPALAESWVVTDDGLSFIFRIKRAQWSDGVQVNARDVARSLKQSIALGSKNRLKPLFGAVTEIVAMTDWVIEIRLATPQPLLLQLLAQPEMAILRGGRGTGPYRIHRRYPNSLTLRPALLPGHKVEDVSEEVLSRRERRIRGEDGARAVTRFEEGGAALVLGGTFDTLPFAQAVGLPQGQLRRDPGMGLFGLVAMRGSAIADDRDLRRALAMSIDRERLLSRFRAEGWQPAETLLTAPIGGERAMPGWAELDSDDRILRARATVSGWKSRAKTAPSIRVAIPKGPGGRLLFAQLAADWSAIGVRAVHVAPGDASDFKLIDNVAPYGGNLWTVARFSCGQISLCSDVADAELANLRRSTDPQARLDALKRADRALVDAQIFIPLATPLRWSLVAPRLRGYSDNAFAIHALNRIGRAGG
jgi:oligopeptide transport system substrate-binding protein